MRKIKLTRGYYAIVDDCDYELVSRNKWYCCGRDGKKPRYAARIELDGKKRIPRWMHRVIINAPDGMEVDHINGDGLDNRRCNLRLCTRSQNQMNRRVASCSTTGYKGVSLNNGNKYRARIGVNGRSIFLGNFDSPEMAHQAYTVASMRYFGEFARAK